MNLQQHSYFLSILLCVALTACGGGSSGGGVAVAPANSSTIAITTPTTTISTTTTVTVSYPAGSLTASNIPTTNYQAADGKIFADFQKYGDVWASAGLLVVDAGIGGLAISEDGGLTFKPAKESCGQVAIGNNRIVSAGNNACVRVHQKNSNDEWSGTDSTALKITHTSLGSPFVHNVQSIGFDGAKFYALLDDFRNNNNLASFYSSSDGLVWEKLAERFHWACNLRQIQRRSTGEIDFCNKTSADGGATWKNTLLPENAGYPRTSAYYTGAEFGEHIRFALDDGTFVSIRSSSGLYSPAGGITVRMSRDQGQTYSTTSSDLSQRLAGHDIQGGQSMGNSIYIVANKNFEVTDTIGSFYTTSLVILKSEDRGSSWWPVDSGLATKAAYFDKGIVLAKTNSDLYLNLKDNYSGDSYLYKINNTTPTWSLISQAEDMRIKTLSSKNGICTRTTSKSGNIGRSSPQTAQPTLVIPPLERTQISRDGLVWETIANELLPDVLDDFGTRLRVIGYWEWASTVQRSVEKYNESTKQWKTVLRFASAQQQINISSHGNTLYASSSVDKKVYSSKDKGETWIAVADLPAKYWGFSAFGTTEFMNVNYELPCIGNCTYPVDYVRGLTISEDNLMTWRRVPEFGTPRSVAFGLDTFVSTISYSPGIGVLRKPYRNARIVEPTLGGSTVNSEYAFGSVFFVDNSFLISGVGGKLHVSADRGDSWKTVQLGFSTPIANVATCGGRLLFSTNYGIHVSPKF